MKKFLFSILIFSLLLGCNRNLQSQVENAEKNCKFYFDKAIDANVFYDLKSPAYYEQGKMDFLKLLNTIPVKVQEGHYGHVYMYLIIDTKGKVSKIGFDKKVSLSLEKELMTLLENSGGWISGKCGEEEVISKVNFTFTW